jgi:hypothetical protein
MPIDLSSLAKDGSAQDERNGGASKRDRLQHWLPPWSLLKFPDGGPAAVTEPDMAT